MRAPKSKVTLAQSLATAIAEILSPGTDWSRVVTILDDAFGFAERMRVAQVRAIDAADESERDAP